MMGLSGRKGQFYSACFEFYEFFDASSDFSDEFYEVNSAP